MLPMLREIKFVAGPEQRLHELLEVSHLVKTVETTGNSPMVH